MVTAELIATLRRLDPDGDMIVEVVCQDEAWGIDSVEPEVEPRENVLLIVTDG